MTIKLWDESFPSVEHAFHWKRAMEAGDEDRASMILRADSISSAEFYGSKIPAGVHDAYWLEFVKLVDGSQNNG